MKHRWNTGIWLGLLLLALTGCVQTGPAVVASSIPPTQPLVPVTSTATQPVPTLAPTATAEPPLSIDSRQLTDSGKAPTFEIKLDYPFLVGPDTPSVNGFNQAVQQITDRLVSDFKNGLSIALADDFPNGPTGFSSLQSEFEIKNSAAGLISVYFQMSQYYRGAAHPFPFSTTLNYSTQLGRPVSLEELFKPGTNYLQLISDSCINELKKNDWFIFPEGAEPKVENYSHWNITPQGLLITFDPYQVAAYAVGFQSVTLPWDSLKAYLDPNGPMGDLLK